MFKASKISPRTCLWMMWCVWVLLVGCVQLYRLTHFADTGFDLAIYSQVMWNATHGAGFWSSIQGHSYWSDHFEPALFIFWPFMRLFFSPLWLLWAQTLALASSIFPLYRLTQRSLSPRLSLAIPGLFLVFPGIWNAATLEFHVLALAFPLIIWAALVLEEKKVRLWQWSLLLLTLGLVREELGLVVIGFGILAALKKSGKAWWLPPLVIGAATVIGAHFVQSAFISTYRYTYYFPWIDLLLHGQYSAGFSTILHLLFRLDTLRMLLAAIFSLGLIWLLAAEWLVPAVPVVVSFVLLNANNSTSLIDGYHATVPLALIFVALPFAIRRLHVWFERQPKFKSIFPNGLLLLVVALIQLTTWYFLWAAYPNTTSDYQPEDLAALIQTIPANEGVAASAAFLPLLANRTKLQATWYIFSGRDEFQTTDYTLDPAIDWILFDTNEFLDLRTQRKDFWTQQQQFLDLLNAEFRVRSHVGSIILYQRTSEPVQRTTVLPPFQEYQSGTPDSIPPAAAQTALDFLIPGDQTRLVGNHVFFDVYIAHPALWAEFEKDFHTPVVVITHGADHLQIPLGYGQLSPDTVQPGDRLLMDIILPDRFLRKGPTNQLDIQLQLIELQGLTYGRHVTIVDRTQGVEDLLDKTVPIQ